MKINRTKLKKEISLALEEARSLEQQSQFEPSWAKLTEAHILSQPYTLLHLRVHWNMLLSAIRHSNKQEIFGQLLRLLVAAPGSLLGKYPVGNTGRSNVNMFLPMPIPLETQKKIERLKE